MMSSTTTGGGSAAILASASSPSTAVVTSYPSRWRRFDSAWRSVGLSSTTNTLLFTIAHSFCRNRNRALARPDFPCPCPSYVHLLHGRPQSLYEHVEGRAPLLAVPAAVEERADRVAVDHQHVEQGVAQ